MFLMVLLSSMPCARLLFFHAALKSWASKCQVGLLSSFYNLSYGFISLNLQVFSLSSRSFYLEKGALALHFCKKI